MYSGNWLDFCCFHVLRRDDLPFSFNLALRQRFEGSNPKRVGADHVKAVIRQGNSGDATSHDPMW